jgi:hypothetical protein
VAEAGDEAYGALVGTGEVKNGHPRTLSQRGTELL